MIIMKGSQKFCLLKLDMQKSFFELYRQVWHAPPKMFASTVLTAEPDLYGR
jgi:hypothetical protein